MSVEENEKEVFNNIYSLLSSPFLVPHMDDMDFEDALGLAANIPLLPAVKHLGMAGALCGALVRALRGTPGTARKLVALASEVQRHVPSLVQAALREAAAAANAEPLARAALAGYKVAASGQQDEGQIVAITREVADALAALTGSGDNVLVAVMLAGLGDDSTRRAYEPPSAVMDKLGEDGVAFWVDNKFGEETKTVSLLAALESAAGADLDRGAVRAALFGERGRDRNYC